MISACCRRVANRDSGGDLEGKLRHPRGERPQVLLAQQRGRHQHGHLVAGIDRLERRPHRQLRLAVAHVAAEQAVHRPRLAHVVLDGVDGGQLVGAFRGRGTRRRTRAATRCRRER